MPRSRRRALRPRVELLDARRLPSGLTPSQVVSAYGLDAIGYSRDGQPIRGDGAGQTIAIVTAFHAPNLAGDLAVFSQKFGLPDAGVTQITMPGARPDESWALEAALDVEWAHAIAPGANLAVVEAASDAMPDMLAAVNQARTIPGVSVVSMSWGSKEFPGLGAYHTYFTTPAGHNGVTFVASTGDDGAKGRASRPAVSTNVVAVGGTSLRVDASGRYLGESAWSQGGGATSQYEARPSYQSATGLGVRSVPDVSALADPSTGVEVYATSPTSGRGSWQVAGGTSLAAPIWAGLIAVANQGRALLGLGTLDGPSQTLPALYAAPSESFHDVAAGSNGYAASPGFDVPTGRGTPNGALVVRDLITWSGAAGALPVTGLPTATPGGTAGGVGWLPGGSGRWLGWSSPRRGAGWGLSWTRYRSTSWLSARRSLPASTAATGAVPSPTRWVADAPGLGPAERPLRPA